jgi:hypothetical protein
MSFWMGRRKTTALTGGLARFCHPEASHQREITKAANEDSLDVPF